VDRVSILYTRAALIWLVAGVTLGALMLSDSLVPGSWRLWFAPTHGHMLFVGWFLQFAIGVAYWLLPRKRNTSLPYGYNERIATAGIALLNLGLGVRVIAEPLGRAGYDSTAQHLALALSSVLQLAAILIIVAQIWKRLIPRPAKLVRDGKPVGGDTAERP
jgi:hypothetical protein